MPAMRIRISQPAQRRVQLRVPLMLRQAGGQDPAQQGPGSGHAGCNRPVQRLASSVRDRWFAERKALGTRLSDDELRHGVNAGIISSALLI